MKANKHLLRHFTKNCPKIKFCQSVALIGNDELGRTFLGSLQGASYLRPPLEKMKKFYLLKSLFNYISKLSKKSFGRGGRSEPWTHWTNCSPLPDYNDRKVAPKKFYKKRGAKKYIFSDFNPETTQVIKYYSRHYPASKMQ